MVVEAGLALDSLGSFHVSAAAAPPPSPLKLASLLLFSLMDFRRVQLMKSFYFGLQSDLIELHPCFFWSLSTFEFAWGVNFDLGSSLLNLA